MADPFIRASTRQIPVGQGGYMLGEVRIGKPGAEEVFRYGFDCGSINREHLERGLRNWSYPRLDVLFISHLDADHVNGVDALTAVTDVDTVVLPCLDELQAITLACETMGPAGTPATVRQFLGDPAGWFAARGVKRVVYVRRDGDGGDTVPFDPSPDNRPGDDFFQQPIGPERSFSLVGRGSGQPTVSKSVEFRTLDAACSLELDAATSTGARLRWLLVPYVHPFPDDILALFRAAARKVLPMNPSDTGPASPSFAKRLLKLLGEEASRRKLKACYSILSTDHNKPSLSLYSGPDAAGASVHHRADSGHGYWHGDRGGWLTTGDADLASVQTRTPWLRRYERLMDRVAVFVLPHHGSNRSLHESVIERLQDSVIGRLHEGLAVLACAELKRKKHPHPLLRVRLQPLDVIQVSERPDSAFWLEVKVRP